MCQEALDLVGSNGGEKTESKCRKTKIRICGPPANQVSFHALLVEWSGQQQRLLQWLQVLGTQEMQSAQALDKGP